MIMERYAEYFRAVHGVDPFPWQSRLATRVLEGRGWPSVIALPTAAGKTAAIDIAVYALAMSGHENPQPRRIFFVVDRRIIVDAAFQRALSLAQRLQQALDEPEGILRDVAERLMKLGGDVPLQAASLRGGVYRDHSWARSPVQPLVCASTVDQVGSRLLFRGYGLATGPTNMLPIHAGLVGNDALIILDEAHISRPFEETLVSMRRYRAWADMPIVCPWEVVRMSATADADEAEILHDEEEDRMHPVLGARLDASKRARLVEIKGDEETAARLAHEAHRVLEGDPDARVVGVIANRVRTARHAFDLLRATDGTDAILLIGRSRPWDRDALLAEHLHRIAAGRIRDPSDRPLFVVATQCIEVGADLDFDALVTECAGLDALRQRFGRLDRLGERRRNEAVIVAHRDQIRKNAVDPVYGGALSATWRWLKDQLPGKGAERFVDFGVSALSSCLQDAPLETLSSPRRRAPVMLPAHVDRWAQTSPIPSPDPSVSLFLHGPETSPADVQFVWRLDLPLEQPSAWADTVALVPPTSAECLPVPFLVARDWLAGVAAADVSDVEAEESVEQSLVSTPRESDRRALRWRGAHDEGTELINAAEIRPGDTLVVPSAYGGADVFGWNPNSDSVQDIAEATSARQRLLAVIRLHPTTLALGGPEPEGLGARVAELVAALESDEAIEPVETSLLEELVEGASAQEWFRDAAKALLADSRRRRIPYPDGRGVVLVGSRRLATQSPFGAFDQITDEDAAVSLTRAVPLDEHTSGVRALTRQFAHLCQLPDAIAGDLEIAAAIHDLGKADPRFQIMLHDGDEVAAASAAQPLAKSGMSPRNRRAFVRAFERSGLPYGYRHEATSVALATSAPDLFADATDSELVLHLAASHHGAARPFLPPIDDRHPARVFAHFEDGVIEASSATGLARLDSGVSDRFWVCVRRYGWYGIAYLEMILRLADQHQSAAEAESSA